MFDAETIREALKQGAGFFVALIMFVVWLQEKKNDNKKADETQKRLEGIIYDRKTDRDKTNTTLARIEVHLDRTELSRDIFRDVAKQALDEVEEEKNPKRRRLDRLLLHAREVHEADLSATLAAEASKRR